MHADLNQIQAFLKAEFPQSLTKCHIEAVDRCYARVGYSINADDLRPGGTVSGPAFSIADFAMYVAILAELGLLALAVTSNLNINFLRKPVAHADLWAECHLIKTGRQLVVGEVWVYSVGQADAVAHVTANYVLPSSIQ